VVDGIARSVVLACPVIAWSGSVWRIHGRRFVATDPGGALVLSGRYHRGRDLFPVNAVFPALYTSAGPEIATWEMIRHSRRSTAIAMWQRFTTVHLSRLQLTLEAVLDLRDPSATGISQADLIGDDYTLTQAIGAVAAAEGHEGLIVPTATGIGEPGAAFNVVIFTDNVRPGSTIAVVETRSPNLPP
jgi:hypothetical protein